MITPILQSMDLMRVIEQALLVTERTADFIRSHAGKVTADKIEIKSRNSLVSFVDQEAERMLVQGLQPVIPQAGFITEEATITQSTSAYTWIIDPLDGTTNFLHHIPVYAISVGLMFDEKIIGGIVCDIAQKETFYAWKGGGAWCNGHPVHVSDRDKMGDALIATGFPYSAIDVIPELTEVFDFFLKNARGVRRLGSAAIDLAYVACGRFDAYYESSLNAWDIAAGILLVEEAGGKVTDFSDGDAMLSSGDIIASTHTLYPDVSRQIRQIYEARRSG